MDDFWGTSSSPVFYNGQGIDEMSWDKESTVESTMVLEPGPKPEKPVKVDDVSTEAPEQEESLEE